MQENISKSYKLAISLSRMASTQRSAEKLMFEKAYVDGKWVSAKSGKTFDGKQVL